MKLPAVEFKAAHSVEETVALLSEHGDEAKVLAGGQSLIPLMALRMAQPAVLVDVNRVPGISAIEADGTRLRIGALARHAMVERSPEVARGEPMLSAAVRHIGHAAIRSRGTIGGSVAHADPSAEIPAVLTALEGSVEVVSSRGSRRIASGDLFEGFLSTSVQPDELITEISLPVRQGRTGWSFHEFARRSGDFALVSCAVAVWLDESGVVSDARIALAGVGGRPLRLAGAEEVIRGARPGPEVTAAAAEAGARDAPVSSDIHGTAAYRRHLVRVLTRKGIEQALERAGRDA